MTDFAVLFVDDEPLTRKITSRLLSRHFAVVEAESGNSALDYLRATEMNIGVLITDMRMANIDGMSLIKQVSEKYPEISIIASTGDLANYDFADLKKQGRIYDALEKPWDIETALDTIRGAMQQFLDNGNHGTAPSQV